MGRTQKETHPSQTFSSHKHLAIACLQAHLVAAAWGCERSARKVGRDSANSTSCGMGAGSRARACGHGGAHRGLVGGRRQGANNLL